MAADCTIKFDGIDGESKKPAGEVDVLSWSWNVMQKSGSSSGGGSGLGAAVPGEFQFSHAYDKASPVLAKKCVMGEHFKTVKLTARKAGGGQQEFLSVAFKEAFVTSVRPGGSSGGDILEQVTLTYKDVEFTYKPQEATGTTGGDVKFGWEIGQDPR